MVCKAVAKGSPEYQRASLPGAMRMSVSQSSSAYQQQRHGHDQAWQVITMTSMNLEIQALLIKRRHDACTGQSNRIVVEHHNKCDGKYVFLRCVPGQKRWRAALVQLPMCRFSSPENATYCMRREPFDHESPGRASAYAWLTMD